MKKEDLIDAIGNIDEKKIERAGKRMENGNREKRSFAGWRTALVAACFAGIVAVVALPLLNRKEVSDIPQGEIVPGNVITEGKDGGEEKEKHGVVDTYVAQISKICINSSEDYFQTYPITTHLPYNYMKYDNYFGRKIPESVWNSIMADFEGAVGVEYENFRADLPEGFTQTGFHTVSLRGYKNPDYEKDIYELNDFVLEYSNGEGAEIVVAMSGKGATFTGNLTPAFLEEFKKLEKSTVCGVEMTIIKYYDCFDVRFAKDGVGYFVSFQGCSQSQLEEFLSWLTLRKQNTIDAPSDVGVIYAEAITPEMLTDKTEDIFCGAYIDDEGIYTVLLTEVTEENIASVSSAFGIDEKTTVFKDGEYTLSYLTELQEKITEKMMAGELPFVVTSGVYESENRIMVGVLESTEESEKEKVLELDRIGGAIEFEITQAMSTELLAAIG